jgi:hypothetical protein
MLKKFVFLSIHYIIYIKVILFTFLSLSFCSGSDEEVVTVLISLFVGVIIVFTGSICFSQFLKQDLVLEQKNNQLLANIRELQEHLKTSHNDLPIKNEVESWLNMFSTLNFENIPEIEAFILKYISIATSDSIKTRLIDLSAMLTKMQVVILKSQQVEICLIVVAVTFIFYAIHMYYAYDIYAKASNCFHGSKIFFNKILAPYKNKFFIGPDCP